MLGLIVLLTDFSGRRHGAPLRLCPVMLAHVYIYNYFRFWCVNVTLWLLSWRGARRDFDDWWYVVVEFNLMSPEKLLIQKYYIFNWCVYLLLFMI
jgi:hypothetical protein